MSKGTVEQDDAESYDRYYDAVFGGPAVRVRPGECYVSTDPGEMVVTVLGSCVAACVRDPLTGLGGMNHFMLAESDSGEWGGVSHAMRYGNHAMERLINAILRTGCPRNRLEIKLFGASSLGVGGGRVGQANADFVRRYVAHEGLSVAAADLGGDQPRRIHYFPKDGRVKRLLLNPAEQAAVRTGETAYRRRC
ncbi:MAG: chemoreceptor glutamine deamidase CheD [Pseudomonadota bacterium]